MGDTMDNIHDKSCDELRDIIDRWDFIITHPGTDLRNDYEFLDNLELYLSKALINAFGEIACNKVGAILTIVTNEIAETKEK